jgi:hypothetical protein
MYVARSCALVKGGKIGESFGFALMAPLEMLEVL